MMRFRSPWLSHLPQIEVKGRLARQSVRLTFFGVVGFLLLLLLLLIWQPTARRGPVYLLYWLHDRLFLPFKAYTYTIFFPTSIIWWGIATTVFALWLTSFLADRSLILQPHLWLLRFTIHQPGLHPALVGFAQWFKQRAIEPDLLKTVAEQERALAGSHLGALLPTRADPIALRATVRFTKLLVQLYSLPTSPLADHLYATVLWYEALVLLLVWDVAAGSEEEQLKTEGLGELAAGATTLRQRLPRRANSTINDDRTQPSPFAPASLTADFELTCYSQPVIAQQLLGADEAMRLDSYKIRAQLARSVASRHVLLNRLCRQLAVDQSGNRLRFAPAEDGLGLALEPPLTARDLTMIGRLSFGIALYAACLGAAPEIALGYLDTIETLSFTLAFSADPQPDLADAAPSMHKELGALVAALPTTLDYQLCATLQASAIQARQQTWADSPLDNEELVLPADFDLAYTYAATIMHAAGPPPATESYVSYERDWVENALAQLQRLGPAYALAQRYAPVYAAKTSERLAAYTHVVTEQAEALYAKYGSAEELPDAVHTLRAQARLGLQKIWQQGQSLHAEYIASGQAAAFFSKQWRQCREYIDALRKSWK